MISNYKPQDLVTIANNLEEKVKRQQDEINKLNTLLNGRDDFIVTSGLWSVFTNQLPDRTPT